MPRSAKLLWKPRAAAGSSANTPSATATPTPAWCSTRSPGSRKTSPRRSRRPPTPRLTDALAAIRAGRRRDAGGGIGGAQRHGAGAASRADPQRRPRHPGDQLAPARDRRRRPHLRHPRFAGGRDGGQRGTNLVRETAARGRRRLCRCCWAELAEYEARGDVQAKAPPEEEARVVPFPAPAEAVPVAEVETAEPEPPPTDDGSAA